MYLLLVSVVPTVLSCGGNIKLALADRETLQTYPPQKKGTRCVNQYQLIWHDLGCYNLQVVTKVGMQSEGMQWVSHIDS